MIYYQKERMVEIRRRHPTDDHQYLPVKRVRLGLVRVRVRVRTPISLDHHCHYLPVKRPSVVASIFAPPRSNACNKRQKKATIDTWKDVRIKWVKSNGLRSCLDGDGCRRVRRYETEVTLRQGTLPFLAARWMGFHPLASPTSVAPPLRVFLRCCLHRAW